MDFFTKEKIYESYKAGKHTDMKVICDDGTTLPMSKYIVCTQSKVLEAAMSSTFKEGSTAEYYLPGKNSATVIVLFHILHGKPMIIPASGREPEIFSDFVLLCAEVYSLADELLMDHVMEQCTKDVVTMLETDAVCQSPESISDMRPRLDLSKSMDFLMNNSTRGLSFLQALLENHFLACRKTLCNDESGGFRHEHYKYIMMDPDLRSIMASTILQIVYDDPIDFFQDHRITQTPEWQRAIHDYDFSKAVLDCWLTRPRRLDYKTLNRYEGWSAGILKSGLSHIFLERQMCSPWRLGLFDMSTCRVCGKVYIYTNIIQPAETPTKCDLDSCKSDLVVVRSYSIRSSAGPRDYTNFLADQWWNLTQSLLEVTSMAEMIREVMH